MSKPSQSQINKANKTLAKNAKVCEELFKESVE